MNDFLLSFFRETMAKDIRNIKYQSNVIYAKCLMDFCALGLIAVGATVYFLSVKKELFGDHQTTPRICVSTETQTDPVTEEKPLPQETSSFFFIE